MVYLPVSDFKNGIADALNRVAYGRERVYLRRHGKDVAVLVSVREAKLLEALDREEDELDTAQALATLKKLRAGEDEVVAWEGVKGGSRKSGKRS